MHQIACVDRVFPQVVKTDRRRGGVASSSTRLFTADQQPRHPHVAAFPVITPRADPSAMSSLGCRPATRMVTPWAPAGEGSAPLTKIPERLWIWNEHGVPLFPLPTPSSDVRQCAFLEVALAKMLDDLRNEQNVLMPDHLGRSRHGMRNVPQAADAAAVFSAIRYDLSQMHREIDVLDMGLLELQRLIFGLLPRHSQLVECLRTRFAEFWAVTERTQQMLLAEADKLHGELCSVKHDDDAATSIMVLSAVSRKLERAVKRGQNFARSHERNKLSEQNTLSNITGDMTVATVLAVDAAAAQSKADLNKADPSAAIEAVVATAAAEAAANASIGGPDAEVAAAVRAANIADSKATDSGVAAAAVAFVTAKTMTRIAEAAARVRTGNAGTVGQVQPWPHLGMMDQQNKSVRRETPRGTRSNTPREIRAATPALEMEDNVAAVTKLIKKHEAEITRLQLEVSSMHVSAVLLAAAFQSRGASEKRLTAILQLQDPPYSVITEQALAAQALSSTQSDRLSLVNLKVKQMVVLCDRSMCDLRRQMHEGRIMVEDNLLGFFRERVFTVKSSQPAMYAEIEKTFVEQGENTGPDMDERDLDERVFMAASSLLTEKTMSKEGLLYAARGLKILDDLCRSGLKRNEALQSTNQGQKQALDSITERHRVSDAANEQQRKFDRAEKERLEESLESMEGQLETMMQTRPDPGDLLLLRKSRDLLMRYGSGPNQPLPFDRIERCLLALLAFSVNLENSQDVEDLSVVLASVGTVPDLKDMIIQAASAAEELALKEEELTLYQLQVKQLDGAATHPALVGFGKALKEQKFDFMALSDATSMARMLKRLAASKMSPEHFDSLCNLSGKHLEALCVSLKPDAAGTCNLLKATVTSEMTMNELALTISSCTKDQFKVFATSVLGEDRFASADEVRSDSADPKYNDIKYREDISVDVDSKSGFFSPLGSSTDVPKHLRWTKPIRNRNITKRDLRVMVFELIEARDLMAQKERRLTTLSEFLFSYLHNKYGVKSVVVEVGYNLHFGLDKYLYDPLCLLFHSVLTGLRNEEVLEARSRLIGDLCSELEGVDMKVSGSHLTGSVILSDWTGVLSSVFASYGYDVENCVEKCCAAAKAERAMFEDSDSSSGSSTGVSYLQVLEDMDSQVHKVLCKIVLEERHKGDDDSHIRVGKLVELQPEDVQLKASHHITHRRIFNVTADRLTNMIQNMIVAHFDHGDVIIRQGDLGEDYFYIESGHCAVHIDYNPDAPGDPVKKFKSGDSFGELALVHSVRRNASVIATSSMVCFVLGRSAFREALMAESEYHYSIVYGTLSALQYEGAPLGDTLSPEALADLADNTQKCEIEDEEEIQFRGVRPSAVYIVLNGLIVPDLKEEEKEPVQSTSGTTDQVIGLSDVLQASFSEYSYVSSGVSTCLRIKADDFLRIVVSKAKVKAEHHAAGFKHGWMALQWSRYQVHPTLQGFLDFGDDESLQEILPCARMHLIVAQLVQARLAALDEDPEDAGHESMQHCIAETMLLLPVAEFESFGGLDTLMVARRRLCLFLHNVKEHYANDCCLQWFANMMFAPPPLTNMCMEIVGKLFPGSKVLPWAHVQIESSVALNALQQVLVSPDVAIDKRGRDNLFFTDDQFRTEMAGKVIALCEPGKDVIEVQAFLDLVTETWVAQEALCRNHLTRVFHQHCAKSESSVGLSVFEKVVFECDPTAVARQVRRLFFKTCKFCSRDSINIEGLLIVSYSLNCGAIYNAVGNSE